GLAVAAAQAAAAMLAAGRPAGPSGRPEVAGTKSSPTDVVTEMDRAAEALIRQRLLAARPGDAILGDGGGEEGGRAGGPARGGRCGRGGGPPGRRGAGRWRAPSRAPPTWSPRWTGRRRR